MRIAGGFVLVLGFLTSITLALFVTHPCGGPLHEFETCGAWIPAAVVAGLSIVIGGVFLWVGRRRRDGARNMPGGM